VCPAGCGLGNDDDCTSCFVDLGLTVLDTCTNLEWEKKNGDDGTPGTGMVNAANLQDVDNRYAWAGKCTTLTSFVYCQPNAAAAATCAAQAGAAVNGCGLCGMADGTCDVQALSGPGVVAITTVWDWLNQLNAAAFAGHGDWRLATTAGTVAIPTGLPSELESIRDVTLGLCGGGSGACIDPVFGPTAIGVFGTSGPVCHPPRRRPTVPGTSSSTTTSSTSSRRRYRFRCARCAPPRSGANRDSREAEDGVVRSDPRIRVMRALYRRTALS
jgi:hypothetical protein